MDTERRELLKMLGVGGGVGIGAIAGATIYRRRQPETDSDGPTDIPSETERRHSDEFGTVVNAVAAGADPTGEDPINEVLERYANDDTLISFSEGTYRLEPIELSEFSNFGIAAADTNWPTFVGEPGNCFNGGSSYVRFNRVEDFLLDGITFDFTEDSTGGTIRIVATGDTTVANVGASGRCEGQIAQFRFDVIEEDARAVVDNLHIENERRDEWLTGIFVGRPHAGELVFRNCNVEGYTDNGLYASAPGLEDGAGGPVHVEGGTYRNNNVANVRLGSEGSTASDVTSISDTSPPSSGDVTANARGFRLRSGQGQLIEDCTVRVTRNSKFTHGGIVFHETNGGATVRETTVEVDRNDTPAIRLFERDNRHTETPVFDGVEVSGTANNGMSVLVSGRDETVFRNCTIEGTGTERNGIVFQESEDCRLIDSSIDVTNHPLVLRNSTVLIENTTITTPDGTEEIDRMNATDEAFTPRGER